MTALENLARLRMEEAEILRDTRTRVLLAVVRQERPTVRSVAEEANRTVSVVHRQLLRLRADGLVWWERDHKATLRPLVREVPFGEAA